MYKTSATHAQNLLSMMEYKQQYLNSDSMGVMLFSLNSFSGYYFFTECKLLFGKRELTSSYKDWMGKYV